jgi:GntR family transcriptional regulator
VPRHARPKIDTPMGGAAGPQRGPAVLFGPGSVRRATVQGGGEPSTLFRAMRKQGRATPAYRELADQLRAAIERNGAEAQLPTEAELSRRYGLSRQTVRRAYQELVADGVVTRVPGRGTFPRPAGPYVRSFGSFEDLLAQSSDTEMELVAPLQVVERPHPGAVERLRTGQVMEVRARRLHDGLPYCVSVVSLPVPVGRRLARVRLLRTVGARRKTTVLELLDSVLEPPIMTARQDITVDVAPPDVAPMLDLPPRCPVLRIDRLYLDADDRPVEFTVSYLNPERYTYRLELKRTLK